MTTQKFELETTFSEYTEVNPNFAKVLINIAYSDKNRNKSNISRTAFERAIPTLKYIPVVGHYLEEEGIFGGHDSELIISNDGNIEENVLTIPYGVVGSETPFWKQYKHDNGEYKEYLCCYAYLWIERYPELKCIKDRDFHQSMEILVKDYAYLDDGTVDIKNFIFDALCILERDEPCFEESKITLDFSKNTFEEEYNKMLESFKRFALNMEGGNALEDNKEIIDNFEEKEEETEEMKKKRCEEEQENEEKDMKNKKCSEDEEEKPEEEEMKKKKCENEEEVEKVNYSEIIASLRDEISELEESYSRLEEKYNSVNEELVSLREFKASKDLEERNAKEEEIFEQYNDDLSEVKEFAKLKENSKKYSLEELNEKCLLIWAKNERNNRKSSKKFNKEDKKEEVYVYDKKDSKNDLGAWSIL